MKKKILVFYHGNTYGGIDTFLKGLLPALADNFKLVVVSIHDSTDMMALLDKDKVVFYKVPLNKWFLGFGLFHLASLIVKEKINIILSMELVISGLVRPIKIFFPRVKHVTSVCCDGREFNKDSQSLLNFFFTTLNKLTFFLVDKYICISRFLADSYLIEEGIPRTRIEVIYLGVDHNASNNVSMVDRPFSPFRVGYIGRRSHEKGFDIYLEVAKRFVDQQDNFQFNYAGVGEFFEKQAQELCKAFPGFFVDRGYFADVSKFYEQMDCIIIPSRSEGFCYIVLEAYKYDNLVVSSDAGALPELVQDGENGLICRSENVDDFVKALALLQKEAGLRKRLIDNSKSALQRFSLNKMQENYVAFFKGV
ncbi:MAG: glycosyltransferase family 4 protein [Candidatus Margulisiibacteriota bacterium]|nr:glycosyltransferase family 4 protein [Candidatus Margulisiibacteriota bacterium]